MTPPFMAIQDSVVVESPLPGGAAEVFRFLFNFPQWAQIAGFFVGLTVVLMLLRHLWKKREAIATWLRNRSQKLKWALGGGVVVGGLAFIGVGGATWNYMQHDNDFCTGCHIMESPFQKFGQGAGRHEELQCHDCHQQPITTSMWQLALWVAERPEKIEAHAPVPNDRCNECHATGQDSTWQRIATTAGHRTHLESDSTALDSILCVTCHGEEIHQFVPVARTCGQSGCHRNEDTRFVLGRMAEQTDAHCTECHQFAADVPLLATYDSARGTLVPNDVQCFSCHQMRELLADFNPRLDPHSSTCGMCHNPHQQEQSTDAAMTCQDCHNDWRDTPFHVGENHRQQAENCTTCHPAHASKVDASDCVGCHQAVNSTGVNRHAPLPFDTSAALREARAPDRGERLLLAVGLHGPPPSGWTGSGHGTSGSLKRDESSDVLQRLVPTADLTEQREERPRGKGDVLPVPASPMTPSPADTFPHDRHEVMSCIECHLTSEGHGGLTFEAPRGCNICHHRGPSTNDCSVCHQAADLETPLTRTVSVTIDDHAPRDRQVSFAHTVHADQDCTACHREPVSMAPDSASAACQACHEDHHAQAATECAQCHHTDAVLEAHTRRQGHEGCDACHTADTISLLEPQRNYCLACHEPDVDHYGDKACSTCHLQSEPGEYQHLLQTSGR